MEALGGELAAAEGARLGGFRVLGFLESPWRALNSLPVCTFLCALEHQLTCIKLCGPQGYLLES